MVVVLAFPHDHIDHAAQRATVLGFNAFTLHLDFLNEVEGHVGVGVASDDVGGGLAFHQVQVLGVRSSGNGIPVGTAVAAVARGNGAGAVAGAIAAHQRFVGGGRGELNHRLEGASMGNILD